MKISIRTGLSMGSCHGFAFEFARFAFFPLLSLVLSLNHAAMADQLVSDDTIQAPVIFASFSGSFATLHDILPREKWECLRETHGGPSSLFSLLYHTHQAAVEHNEIRPDRGFRIAWGFLPNTRAVICIYSQSLSPKAVISSLAYRKDAPLPTPDEEGFTIFPWGGYLSRADHMTAITLSLPPQKTSTLKSEVVEIQHWLAKLDADFVGRDQSGDLEISCFPSRIPKELRELWTNTVLAGLTPSMQKHDGESQSAFQIRSSMAQTELDGLHSLLFQVASMMVVYKKEDLTKESSISFRLESIPGTRLATSLSKIALPQRFVRSNDDSVILDLAITLSIPESPLRSVIAETLCRVAKSIDKQPERDLDDAAFVHINQLASGFATDGLVRWCFRWSESQHQPQVLFRASNLPAESVYQNLMGYLSELQQWSVTTNPVHADDLQFHAVEINRDTDEITWHLTCAADLGSLLLAFANRDCSTEEDQCGCNQFHADYSTHEETAGSAGIAGVFRANQVLPMFCALIDTSNARTYDRANWKSPGENDVANLFCGYDENSFTITASFEEDAFLWGFTTFLNLAELSRSVEYQVYSATRWR